MPGKRGRKRKQGANICDKSVNSGNNGNSNGRQASDVERAVGKPDGKQTDKGTNSVSSVIHGAYATLYGDIMNVNPMYQPPVAFSGQTVISPDGPMSASMTQPGAPVMTQMTQMSPSRSASGIPGVNSNIDICAVMMNMDQKLADISMKLQRIVVVEEKIDKFNERLTAVENDLKMCITQIFDRSKHVDGRLCGLDDRVDAVDFCISSTDVRVEKLEKLESESRQLRESLLDLQARNMRDNLLFVGIPENVIETAADTEKILKTFFVEKLQLDQKFVDEMKIDRAHRITNANNRRPRTIVAKFNNFKDREEVRKSSAKLSGTHMYINEQFPTEIVERRKKLYPVMKAARDEGRRVSLVVDKLFIDGRRHTPQA